MILVDANLLIYAVDSDSPHHKASNRWLRELVEGGTPLFLAWIVALAFLRITTNSRIVFRPLTATAALAVIQELLSHPNVQWVSPGERHWTILQALIVESGTAGNLINDVHLAALAIEKGLTLASADNDFRRFSGVRLVNPVLNAAESQRKAR